MPPLIRSPLQALEENVCEAHTYTLEAIAYWQRLSTLDYGSKQRRLQALRSLQQRCELVINANANAEAVFGRSGLTPLGQALWAASHTTRY